MGWKISDLNQVWIRLLGWSQLSNPSGFPCLFSCKMIKVLLQCRGLLRLIRQGTWCIDRYLWRSCHLVTTEGVNGMDPKTCVDSYDSQRSVHLHRVDKVRWSRRVCTTSQKMLKIFKVNVTILPQPKPRDSISEAIWTRQSYPLHVFCWFQRNKDDITIVAQPLRDLFTTAAKRPSQRRDWNASAIWNHEFSNTNLEIFFLKMYGIPDKHLWNDI